MKKIAVVANSQKINPENFLDTLEDFLKEKGFKLVPIIYAKWDHLPDPNDIDLEPYKNITAIISIGGDGTLLYTARLFSGMHIPIFAVNFGHCGFITEIESIELFDEFNTFIQGKAKIEKRLMLSISIKRGNQSLVHYTALNDGVICLGSITRIIELDCFVNDHHLGKIRSDGLIVSTPTGSTAYSMSAGGPIVLPACEAIIITPICPHSLTVKPFLVSANDIIKVKITEEKKWNQNLYLNIDGKEKFLLQYEDEVIFARHSEQTLLVHSSKRDFYTILKNRFLWINPIQENSHVIRTEY